jgi:hypothetical protein
VLLPREYLEIVKNTNVKFNAGLTELLKNITRLNLNEIRLN